MSLCRQSLFSVLLLVLAAGAACSCGDGDGEGMGMSESGGSSSSDPTTGVGPSSTSESESGTSESTSTSSTSTSTSNGSSSTGAPPACDDARLNGDETDVDCGGSCDGCPIDATCVMDEDCGGVLICSGETCTEPPNASAGIWFITNGPGSNALVDFFSDPPAVTCNGAVGSSTGIEGSATHVDPKGQLRLYTDGISLYNGETNALISDELGGNTSTHEPAAIVPLPGSDGEYIVFTNGTNAGGGGDLAYSIVDLSMGTDGMVTALNQALPEPPAENPGEAMEIMLHDNGTDYWLLTFDGADEFVAHQVTAAGLTSAPVRSPTTLMGSVGRGAIVRNQDGTRIAFGMAVPAVIGLADFDPATGAVSNIDIVIDGDNLGYGVAFSPDETKLYYSQGTEGYDGRPQQYDLLTDTNTELSTTDGTGGVALAPDGRIYFAAVNSNALHRVNDPDAAGAAADYELDALSLAPCTSGYATSAQSARHYSRR